MCVGIVPGCGVLIEGEVVQVCAFACMALNKYVCEVRQE